VEAAFELALELSPCGIQDLSLRNQHDVQEPRRLAAAEAFAQSPFRQVPLHGAADATIDREPETTRALLALQRNHSEKGAIAARAAAEHRAELVATAKAFAAAEPPRPRLLAGRGYSAPIRLRPFWRRRFSTRRPPLLRIRTRKPWVRRLLRLFGWKVRFISGGFGLLGGGLGRARKSQCKKGSRTCQPGLSNDARQACVDRIAVIASLGIRARLLGAFL
jgi:hypothetical protein